MTTHETGSREELRYKRVTQGDRTISTDMTVYPHGGSPTGPSRSGNRGPTDQVDVGLRVRDNVLRSFTVPAGFGNVQLYGAYDEAFEQIFAKAWTAAVSITGTDIASTGTGNKFTSATSGKFDALASQVPCPVWIKRDGATPLSLPAIALSVVTGGSPELVIGTDSQHGKTLTVVGAGDNVTIMHGGVLKEGTTPFYAAIERAQTGLGHYHIGWDLMCSRFQAEWQAAQDPRYSFDFMGTDANNATATYGTGSQTAAPTFPPFNPGTDFAVYQENGEAAPASALFPVRHTLTLDRAPVAIHPLGYTGPKEHELGTLRVSGQSNLFSNNGARLAGQRQITNADTSFMWMDRKTSGGVTNGMVWWVPRAQYSTGEQANGGQDNPVNTNLQWNAALHSTYGLVVCVARLPALPL